MAGNRALVGNVAAIIGLTLVLTHPGPARAGYLSTWIATTCDAPSGRAMVRFGYGDTDGPPRFLEVPTDIDGGVSKTPVVNASQSDARCTLPDGREVKARMGIGPTSSDGKPNGLPFARFSVWVDKIRIIHAADLDMLPYAVIVDGMEYRTCRFHLPEDQPAFDLTAAPMSNDPTPVECSSRARHISGAIDVVEYPLAGSRAAPPIGTILIKRSRDRQLCRKMIAKHSKFPSKEEGDVWPGYGPSIEIVTMRELGGAATPDWRDPSDTLPERSATYDIRNAGREERVLEIAGASTAFHGNYFAAFPLDVPIEEVRGLLQHGFSPASVGSLGGVVLDGKRTRYKDDNVYISILRSSGTTYLLAHPEQPSDPTAVLLKPRADGSMEEICVFQTVSPHF